MKKIMVMLVTLAFLLLPFHGIAVAQDECCDDLQACEELMEEAGNTILDLEARLIEAEAVLENARDNDRDGDVSLADLLEFIPGFRKLPAKQRTLIISIGLAVVALGISYIPPPTE